MDTIVDTIGTSNPIGAIRTIHIREAFQQHREAGAAFGDQRVRVRHNGDFGHRVFVVFGIEICVADCGGGCGRRSRELRWPGRERC